jgi:pyridoxine 4-dehydrogenase
LTYKSIELIGQTIPRMGYGTMRLPGANVWGPPKDYAEAIRLLKKTQELGIKAIDTAWYYGPDVSNDLLAEALHPYPDDLIIITKLGGQRDAQGNWLPFNKPAELREGMERDLKTLKLDAVPIVHLRWMEGSQAEFVAAIDAMLQMKQAGKFQQLGLSTVTEAQLDYVLRLTPVATVSNAYSFQKPDDDAMIDRCEKEGIAYLPYFPLAAGKADDHAVLQAWAKKLDATPTQIALAWLLQRSACILPIPGTSSVAHLQENFAALDIELPAEAIEQLSNAIQ